MTTRDLIKSALRLLGATGTGEEPSANEAADALAALNTLLEAWSADRLTVFTVDRVTKALTAGQQSYTLGTGGDLNTPRPAKVERYGIVIPGGVKLPLNVVDEAGWQALPLDSVQGTFPNVVWDDGGFPLRTLRFWPIPSSGCSVDIYPWEALNSALVLASTVSFPPAYARALKFALALEIAPEFGKTPSDLIIAQARESKAVIMSMNLPTPQMRCEEAALGPNAGGSLEIASMFGIGFTK